MFAYYFIHLNETREKFDLDTIISMDNNYLL